MGKILNKAIAYTLLACSLFAFTACEKMPEPGLNSSDSSLKTEDAFVPELHICRVEAIPKRSADYIYGYEGSAHFSFTFIEEDERYIYLEIASGDCYYLSKSAMSMKACDFIRLNKTTGKEEIIDTRVTSHFTTIKNDMIYYYKIAADGLNAVLMEYNTLSGNIRTIDIEGVPSKLYIAEREGDDHIDWVIQLLGDAGNGIYYYSDSINKCECVVDTNNGKAYALPENGFLCDDNDKYYYGDYDGNYDYYSYSWTSGPKTFRLMVRNIESDTPKEVCRIDFSDEIQVCVGCRYAGNGCIFIWNKFAFGKYWIFDIKTGKLMLKKADKQYDGFYAEPESYWTLTYDDDAFYFAECIDEDYNFEVQKVSYDGFKQEAIKGIYIDYIGDLEICNGYIYVSETDLFSPYRLDKITRYDMDGLNPVEILYNKYEVKRIKSQADASK